MLPEGPEAAPLEAELEEIGSQFSRSLPGKLSELSAIMVAARQDAKHLPRACTVAHRLHGTAASFGYQDVGDLVGNVEALLRRIGAGTGRTEFLWESASQLLRDATRLLRLGPDVTRTAQRSVRFNRRPLLVVDDDVEFLRLIRSYARRHSLRVISAESVDDGINHARTGALCAALLDVHLAENSSLSAVDLIRQTPGNSDLPVIFASVDGTLETRIAAVRAGANRFLDKPLSEQRFSELLHQVPFAEPQSVRIVILDDDEIVVERYESDMRSHGYYVRGLSDLGQLVDVLDDVRPDALLLDVNLGASSGIDVCKALRCSERWQFLPILMFSADKDAEMRVAAYQAGATDVLAKPLSVEELITRVSVQAERVRHMRERSDRDSLSGLMLRRAFVETMQRALASCSREKKRLALVLVDLDHFKSINDSHGHIAGDRVIAAFGELLRSRFRVEDLRGRWGGKSSCSRSQARAASLAWLRRSDSLLNFGKLCLRPTMEVTSKSRSLQAWQNTPEMGKALTFS